MIINNYNYGSFIGDSIYSVLNQTYKNYELIIVDDGSTDNSSEVIESYRQSHGNLLTVIYKENGGQASAFNSGFEVAKGDVIAFLDSDDYWFPEKLERVVEYHKDYDVVEHSLLENGLQCRVLKDKKNSQMDFKKNGRLPYFAPTSALSFKTETLKKVFPIPEEGLKICADTFVFYLATYFTNKIYSLKETLVNYRIHGNNRWANRNNDVKKNNKKILDLVNSRLILNGYMPVLYGEERINYLVSILDVKKDAKYILYGAGGLGTRVYNKILKDGGKVTNFIDSDVTKQGTYKHNREIISLASFRTKYQNNIDYIVVSSSYSYEVLNNLRSIGINKEKIIVMDI